MANYAKALQVAQLKKEVTPGTAVGADTVAPNTKILLAPDGDPNEEYSGEGHLFPSDSSNGLEWSSGKWEAPPTYDESYLVFNSVFKHVNATTGGGGVAKTRVWTPASASADTHDTYSVERGQTGAVEKFTYAIFNTLKLLVGKRIRTLMSGDMLGQEVLPAAALTAVATTIKSSVIPKTGWDIYYATTWAGLAAGTLLSTGFRYEFDYGPVMKDAAFIGSAEPSFNALGIIVPQHALKLTLPYDVSGSDFASFLTLAKKRASTPVFIRLVSTGALLEVGINQKFQIDMSLRVRKVPDETDIDNVFLGLMWELGLYIDETSGNVLEITTIGQTA
jgi:hypothetical protein